MSVYDINGSNFSGSRPFERRIGMQRHACKCESGRYDDSAVSAGASAPDKAPSCDLGGLVVSAPSLAMVYCPRQHWRAILSPDEALKRGTLFAELNMPFLGGKMK